MTYDNDFCTHFCIVGKKLRVLAHKVNLNFYGIIHKGHTLWGGEGWVWKKDSCYFSILFGKDFGQKRTKVGEGVQKCKILEDVLCERSLILKYIFEYYFQEYSFGYIFKIHFIKKDCKIFNLEHEIKKLYKSRWN